MEQGNATPAAPSSMKTLAILSYIGSGFWALISLLLIIASGWLMGMLGMGVSKANDMAAASGASAEELEKMHETTAAAGGMMAMGTGIIIGAGVFMLLLQVLCIMGVSRMTKLKKSGFWMYAVGNGIFAILCILGMSLGSIVTGLVAILFIVLFGMNLKHMR